MLQELNRTNVVRDSLLSLEQLGKSYPEGYHMRVLIEDLKRYDFEIISTNLPAEQEQKLREVFGEEASDVPA
jgi:hypothetical protein